ncbi:MAG: PIN domain-containing protein [Chloroflexi bacterium]|nr:PIN domain-containing protein [Chloroflexota bacterium]
MESTFLDTGYLIAQAMDDDQHYEDAVNHWQRVSQGDLDLVTTSLVLNETVTFINSRGRHSKGVSVGNMLLTSPSVNLIFVDQPLLMEGWEYFKRHDDKRYSLADCVSFVVMERYDIYTAYAFDKDFIQAGFIIEPMRS